MPKFDNVSVGHDRPARDTVNPISRFPPFRPVVLASDPTIRGGYAVFIKMDSGEGAQSENQKRVIGRC